MKRQVQFCCDASRDMYEDYYAKQSGGTMPVFVGSRHQRGHGLGSVLSGLIRSVIVPFLKRNVGALAGNSLKTGAQFVDDTVRGKTFKETAKKQMTVRDVDWQTGSVKSKRKRRRRHKDIFDGKWRSYTKTRASISSPSWNCFPYRRHRPA